MNFKKRINDSWVDTPNYIHKTDTDTFTTLPAVLYPTGSTATVGLKGNTTQSGTPTSDNPIMPNGTGERTGNLFNVEMEQGSISASGVNQSSTARIRTSDFIPLEAGNYVINASASNDLDCFVFIYDTSGTFVERVPSEWTTLPYAFTLSENCRIKVALAYRPADSSVRIVPSDVSNITLNSGSTPLPYEPYGIKIPISSANTTTNIYLGEVESTRQIRKMVLTGEETSWQSASASEGRNRFTLPILNAMQADTAHLTSLSTHLPLGAEGATWNTDDVYTIVSSKLYMRLTAQYNTLADFKSYLAQQYAAGTPVTVWYVLANEETGIVNEPLMRIGDYADEVSGITIPTIAGGDSVDIETTVKPSEVSLTYTGWHDAMVKEWDGSQWQ